MRHLSLEGLEEAIRKCSTIGDRRCDREITCNAEDLFILLRKPPVCDVCWTSSWEPCEEGTSNAVKDPMTGGWMICGFCNENDIANNLRNEVERMKSVLEESVKSNPLRNDRDAYYYVLWNWAMHGYWEDGDDVKHYEKPEKKDYGLE